MPSSPRYFSCCRLLRLILICGVRNCVSSFSSGVSSGSMGSTDSLDSAAFTGPPSASCTPISPLIVEEGMRKGDTGDVTSSVGALLATGCGSGVTAGSSFCCACGLNTPVMPSASPVAPVSFSAFAFKIRSAAPPGRGLNALAANAAFLKRSAAAPGAARFLTIGPRPGRNASPGWDSPPDSASDVGWASASACSFSTTGVTTGVT